MRDYVKTSDTPFAAFLMLHGYTHLGCVDDGDVSKSGMLRISHYLTHSEDEVRSNILEHSNQLRDVFQTEGHQGFREYAFKLHLAKKKTRTPFKNGEMNV